MIEEKETIVDAQTEQQVVEENKNQSESQQESKNAANEFAAEAIAILFHLHSAS